MKVCRTHIESVTIKLRRWNLRHDAYLDANTGSPQENWKAKSHKALKNTVAQNIDIVTNNGKAITDDPQQEPFQPTRSASSSNGSARGVLHQHAAGWAPVGKEYLKHGQKGPSKGASARRSHHLNKQKTNRCAAHYLTATCSQQTSFKEALRTRKPTPVIYPPFIPLHPAAAQAPKG